MKELYTIKEGNFYASGINFKTHFGLESLSFIVTPDANCVYNLGNANNQDINKFFGVTWGWDPDNNSFRSGWNCYKQNGLLQYHYYAHNHGVRDPGPNEDPGKALLFEAPPGEPHRFDLLFNRKKNQVLVISDTETTNAKLRAVPFDFSGVPIFGRYNFPYAGGDQPAQHDMTMRIQLL